MLERLTAAGRALEALGQHHLLPIAPHLGTVEEGHAEQDDVQPLLLNHRIHLVDFDAADPDTIEFHHVRGRGAGLRGARAEGG